jgi:site-specific DNA recombinase
MLNFSRCDRTKLIGSIFPKKFQIEKNEVRTADINPVLLKIASINKGLQRNKKWDKSKKNDLSHLVLKVGIEPTHSKILDFESSASTNSAT